MSAKATALPDLDMDAGRAGSSGAGGTTMMTVRGSCESVEARLRSGLVACWCGGMLRPWGHARPRRVATLAGLAEVRPRRGICRGCGRTHVLLPAWPPTPPEKPLWTNPAPAPPSARKPPPRQTDHHAATLSTTTPPATPPGGVLHAHASPP